MFATQPIGVMRYSNLLEGEEAAPGQESLYVGLWAIRRPAERFWELMMVRQVRWLNRLCSNNN